MKPQQLTLLSAPRKDGRGYTFHPCAGVNVKTGKPCQRAGSIKRGDLFYCPSHPPEKQKHLREYKRYQLEDDSGVIEAHFTTIAEARSFATRLKKNASHRNRPLDIYETTGDIYKKIETI